MSRIRTAALSLSLLAGASIAGCAAEKPQPTNSKIPPVELLGLKLNQQEIDSAIRSFLEETGGFSRIELAKLLRDIGLVSSSEPLLLDKHDFTDLSDLDDRVLINQLVDLGVFGPPEWIRSFEFKSDTEVNMAEMITMLQRLYQLKLVDASDIDLCTGVKSERWYTPPTKAVQARLNKIDFDLCDLNFDPMSRAATRSEFVGLLQTLGLIDTLDS